MFHSRAGNAGAPAAAPTEARPSLTAIPSMRRCRIAENAKKSRCRRTSGAGGSAPCQPPPIYGIR